MVKTDDIHPVLASVQCLLMRLPRLEEVCINADRGFFDIALMTDFSAYGWHWNLRGKAQVHLFGATGQALGQFRTQLCRHGQMVVRHGVYVTAQRYGPVSIAAVLPVGVLDPWFIVSDEPCSTRSFAEYHERTQIEEGFLDLKSAAWHLEDTRLTQLGQFERLLCVLGLATLVTLSEGTAAVAAGQRRQFDLHWVRALSYVQIGWRAIRRRLTQRVGLLERLRLSPAPDPEPSRRRRYPLYFNVVRGFS